MKCNECLKILPSSFLFCCRILLLYNVLRLNIVAKCIFAMTFYGVTVLSQNVKLHITGQNGEDDVYVRKK